MLRRRGAVPKDPLGDQPPRTSAAGVPRRPLARCCPLPSRRPHRRRYPIAARPTTTRHRQRRRHHRRPSRPARASVDVSFVASAVVGPDDTIDVSLSDSIDHSIDAYASYDVYDPTSGSSIHARGSTDATIVDSIANT